MLASTSSVAKTGLQGIIYINLGMQFFMSVAMPIMWSMMNTLQILVHMSLLNVTYPSNAQMVCSAIVDIVNFKLIPTNKILAKFMTFSNSASSRMNPNMSGLGINSTNILQNLGMLFFCLIAIVILIGLLFVMKFAV